MLPLFREVYLAMKSNKKKNNKKIKNQMNQMNRPLINNHYSSIDISTLKSNNFNLPASGRERKMIEIERERISLIEISKYSEQLLKSPNSPQSQIIDSKKIIIKEREDIKNKTSYFEKVDMLRTTKEKEGVQNIIQKYLRSFTTLDIELAQNQNTLYSLYFCKISQKCSTNFIIFFFLAI